MDKVERIAILLYGWMQPSGSRDWADKKTLEVVRIGYRKRAEQVLQVVEDDKQNK